ncbi:D-alanyl-D-alanine carboxypeptidase family protein [Terricaulis silvestris]|uniref:serine-type D-Ala-D-Ala carboxypeptidase n=1 Tax=Terricaulis silvestris TaxID=2686094 RepID=A0A6I6MJ27_9CAUL|nr:D-alanyl-D-alanine carboxypeptidase family protein [Terricaulis silvestris]QGZ95130.1 D-alanyl-D-alanine carboxypeptidase DacA precursor [Terricaulis silvestris]
MKLQRALCAITLIAAMALAPTADAQRRRVRTPAPPPPPAVAQHVTIMDGASGALLDCENCNEPIPPASMAKLMTVLVVLEELQSGRITYNTRYTVSEYAWREHGAMSSGSHMFLPINESVAVRDLIQGAVIVSANDACVVLAEGIAGSEEAFVARMNRRARELGLTTARFRNVTGLDDPEQRISSSDLARLARHLIVNYPAFYRVYGRREFTYNNHTQSNRNPLLGAYPGADGMKTGHTDESGYGLIGSAVLNNERRIIVFNGLPTMAARNAEAQRLMRSGFNDFALTTLAEAGAEVGQAQVRLGGRRTVPLVAQQRIVIGGTRAVQAGLTAHVVYDGPLHPPIREGAEVAHLVVEGPGYETQRFPLVAGRNVGKANWFSRAWEGLRLTFFGP